MSGLARTKTRLDLLRLVEAGRVQLYGDSHTYLDGHGLLDARVAEVRAARWVELAERTVAYRRPWQLTDAGRAALEAGPL